MGWRPDEGIGGFNKQVSQWQPAVKWIRIRDIGDLLDPHPHLDPERMEADADPGSGSALQRMRIRKTGIQARCVAQYRREALVL